MSPPSARAPLEGRRAFEEYLRGRSLRVTTERLAIFEHVMKTDGHFDVDTMLAALQRQRARVSRATLYRTLSHLLESGLVQKVQTGEGQARYEKMYGRHHHDHLICIGCGAIIEFENAEIERLQDWVCKIKKFTIVSHVHQIRGFCEDCSARRSADPARHRPVAPPAPARRGREGRAGD